MEMEFQSLHELKEYMALHSSADQDLQNRNVEQMTE